MKITPLPILGTRLFYQNATTKSADLRTDRKLNCAATVKNLTKKSIAAATKRIPSSPTQGVYDPKPKLRGSSQKCVLL